MVEGEIRVYLWCPFPYLRRVGCKEYLWYYPLVQFSREMLARDGHLSIIQWLRDNGCSWDEDMCTAAAHGGHLTVLQWQRDNGCS